MGRSRARFPNKETRVKFLGGEIHFNFEGRKIQAWRDRLNNFKSAAQDMSPVYAEFGTYQLRSIDRNFTGEGRPSRWAPLAPATIRERIRLGFGAGPILQRTKTLRNAFRTHVGKTFLRILNNTPYFKYHQQDERLGVKLPRRIMVILLDQDKAQFTRIYRRHLGIN